MKLQFISTQKSGASASGGLNGKPTYVDIPNDIVEAMKQMIPQEGSNILLSKEM